MKRFIFVVLIIAGIAAFSAAQNSGSMPFRQEGIASWYGKEFEGKPTASGEIFDLSLYTAAHPTLPFGSLLMVTNTQNMRQVTVRVNDRGPFVAARIIDLSMCAAEALDMISTGTAPVIVEQVFNTALGPVGVSAPTNITAPATPVIATGEPKPDEPKPVESNAVEPKPASPVLEIVNVYDPKEELFPEESEQLISQPPQPPPPATPPQAAVTPVEPVNVAPITAPVQVFYPAPPAEIRGGLPPIESTKFYRLQVGAFKVPRNAVDAFEKLRSAGLDPAYEQNGEFYRVVLAKLRAAEIPSIAQTLGNTGFREAIIREETNF